MKLEKEQIYHEYLQRENDFSRAGYLPELEFYSYVKSGNVAAVERLCHEGFASKKGLGELSHNPLQSLKYHFAITAAMLARYCIEGGMNLSDSYSLSDFYIQKADIAASENEITELHKTMCIDYTRKMKDLRKLAITSMPVAKSIDYIYDHLHTRITVDELAEHAKVSSSYLSRVFKKETGMAISRYIRMKKIETAKNMLIYSDFTPSQISSILAFPSQSYFTEIFKKETGCTPGEYKASHFYKTGLGNTHSK